MAAAGVCGGMVAARSPDDNALDCLGAATFDDFLIALQR